MKTKAFPPYILLLLTIFPAPLHALGADFGPLAPADYWPARINSACGIILHPMNVPDEEFLELAVEQFLFENPEIINFANQHLQGRNFLHTTRRNQKNVRSYRVSGLSESELGILRDYVSGANLKFNNYLRYPEKRSVFDFFTKRKVDRLNRVLEKLPNYSGIVFRGTSIDKAGFAEFTKEGNIVSEPAGWNFPQSFRSFEFPSSFCLVVEKVSSAVDTFRHFHCGIGNIME